MKNENKHLAQEMKQTKDELKVIKKTYDWKHESKHGVFWKDDK